MTITVMTVDDEQGLQSFETLDVLAQLKPGTTLWIDVEKEPEETLHAIGAHFNLHELTIEDCLDVNHSPKLEDYGKYLFMIFRSFSPERFFEEEAAAEEEDGEEHDLEEEDYTQSLAVYLAEDFIITVRNQEIAWLDALVRRVGQVPERTIAAGTDALAHSIVDVLIDRFSRGLNYFETTIDRLEDTIIEDPDVFEVSDVVEIRRHLTFLRQIMRDQRIVITRLAHEGTLIRERQLRRYFRDIEDHALAIIKTIDSQIDSLGGIRDVYFAMVNVRLGDIMRILAVITTIAVPLNLVVGMFGMNFEALPLLHSRHGFWLIVTFMLAVAGTMLFFFRKKHWI